MMVKVEYKIYYSIRQQKDPHLRMVKVEIYYAIPNNTLFSDKDIK